MTEKNYYQKKKEQLSGRPCFLAGSNYNRKNLRPEEKKRYSHATVIGTLDIGTFQITGPGFGRTLVLAGTHTYVASAFSVNETFQIMGPSKDSTQGVPKNVARLYPILHGFCTI
jgi:hypothetical protein